MTLYIDAVCMPEYLVNLSLQHAAECARLHCRQNTGSCLSLDISLTFSVRDHTLGKMRTPTFPWLATYHNCKGTSNYIQYVCIQYNFLLFLDGLPYPWEDVPRRRPPMLHQNPSGGPPRLQTRLLCPAPPAAQQAAPLALSCDLRPLRRAVRSASCFGHRWSRAPEDMTHGSPVPRRQHVGPPAGAPAVI